VSAAPRGPWRRRWAGDTGSIAPLVPIMGLVMLMLGGVVIDGSRLLNARGRAVAYAEEASRAGAGAIVAGQSTLALDEDAVRARVVAYCASLRGDEELGGSLDECQLDDGDGDGGIEPAEDGRRIVVRVRVSMEIATSLVGIVRLEQLTAQGVARARPFEGTTQEDVDADVPALDVTPDTPYELPSGTRTGDDRPDPNDPDCQPGEPAWPGCRADVPDRGDGALGCEPGDPGFPLACPGNRDPGGRGPGADPGAGPGPGADPPEPDPTDAADLGNGFGVPRPGGNG